MRHTALRPVCLWLTRRKLTALALVASGYGLASWTDAPPIQPAPISVTREIVLSNGRPLLRTCLQHPAYTHCTYKEGPHESTR